MYRCTSLLSFLRNVVSRYTPEKKAVVFMPSNKVSFEITTRCISDS
jgi:hypothetical protein